MKFLEKIRRYIRISEVAPISRRYFIMNAFDGATTVLGIVIGAYVVEITNEFWVIWSGLGVSLAMGLSGFAGAYMTEEAEREKRLDALEKSMLTELKDSVVGKASRFASLWAGIVDGVSPALTAVVCLTPFFLSSHGLFSINFAIQLSIAMALSIMFLLGVFLGKISNRNVLFHGAKMLFVGLIITLIFLVLKITQ
jgi:predicted membrane protein (TIGR00267 family)